MRRLWLPLGQFVLCYGLALLASFLWAPRGPAIKVRWMESITTAEQAQLEQRHGLLRGRKTDPRMWWYEILDPNVDRLRHLVADPGVEDTEGFNRGAPTSLPRPPRLALISLGLAAIGWLALTAASCGYRNRDRWVPVVVSSVRKFSAKLSELAQQNRMTLCVASLVILAAAVHGPYLSGLGFYWDEWPLLVSGSGGGGREIAMGKGEARPLVFGLWGLAYSLFGPTPWPYHLWVFLARLGLALGVAWTAACLWPRSPLVFASAALALVYPGFLHSQFGFLYVAHMSFVAIHIVSLGASLAAQKASSRGQAVALHLMAVSMAAVTGFGLFPYLTLAEPYRFALLLYQQRQPGDRTFREDVRAALIRWGPYGAITASLVVWAVLLRPAYHPERDVQAILTVGLQAPGEMALSLVRGAFGSLWTLAVGAWTETTIFAFSGSAGSWSAWGALVGFGVAFSVVFWTASGVSREAGRRTERDDEAHRSAVFLGLAGLVAALLPIVLAGRQIDVGNRYAVAAIGASGIFAAGCLHSLVARRARVLVLSFTVAVAAFPHHSVATEYREIWAAISGFAWQTAWRVPDLTANTLLVQRLPLNLSRSNELPYAAIDKLDYPLRASYPALRDLFVVGNSIDEQRLWDALQTLTSQQSRQDVLILSQTAPGHCVRALSGRTTEQRPVDQQLTRRIGSVYSNPDLIGRGDDAALPSYVAMFGPEPDHGFCYYFQMTSSAIQRGDWETAVRHWEEVRRLELAPATPLEWIPFADALLMTDRRADAERLIAQIRSAPAGSAAWCRYIREIRRHRDRPSVLNAFAVGCRPAKSSE